jgi:uncharacterized membrane protein YjjP (DUF1212 family)
MSVLPGAYLASGNASVEVEGTMPPVETALEAALLVMRNGGSTVAAARSFTNILKGFDQQDVSTIWRLDFIAATTRVDGRSSTFLQSVGPIGVNLTRASAATVLAEGVAQGSVQLAVLRAELDRIKQLHSPYNRWLLMVAAAFAAGCFSQLPGGDRGSFAIAFVAAGVGQYLRSNLHARKLAAAHVTLICGVLSALIASVGLRLGLSQIVPATLIASVIYMAPGLPLINGFVDIASHRYLVVGIDRILNAAFLFLILGIAIVFAHTVAL